MYSVNSSRPLSARISWGLIAPSETMSPFSTLSPSKTFMCLVLGIKVAFSLPSSSVMMSLSLPLVGLPHETIPDSWAKIACSFGFLASKRSATLGRPPVISLVLADSWDILAITPPTSISWPSVSCKKAFPGSVYTAGASESGRVFSFPLPSTICIAGRLSWASPLGLSVTSIISISVSYTHLTLPTICSV